MIEGQPPRQIKNTIACLIHNSKSIHHLHQIHSQILTFPYFTPYHRSFLISRLLFHLCAVSISPLSLPYAARIFGFIPNPTLFTYNAIIRANATRSRGPTSCVCLILYRDLLRRGLVPDSITLPFVMKECSKRADVSSGRAVHARSFGLGYEPNVYVQNALICLYSDCGVLDDARRVFDEMTHRDVVSWNSIIVGCLRSAELDVALELFQEMKDRKNIITWNSVITGLAQGGRPREALEIFHEMQEKSMARPDKMTMASALSACASLGAIDQGRWVHTYLQRSGLECDVAVMTALVDMYGKCGFVEKAMEVFRDIPNKDVLAWTAAISVQALNGLGPKAFRLFSEMEDSGVGPNAVTFVSLLSACAHSGLVSKARWCFDRMRRVYGIGPGPEHYACMVDVLGRAGLFGEVEELIVSMTAKPDAYVWGALLGGCLLHGNVRLGERVAWRLIELEPGNHAFYVLLCDLYAKCGRFGDRERVMGLMREREVRKTVPGSSAIEMGGVVREFSVRGSGGMQMEELESILIVLNSEMKMERDVGRNILE